MSLPTVASLCSILGQHLQPVEGFRAPDTEITAVHISELVDPNAYLSGGELLLTTGLALPSSAIGCRRYVSRLVQARVSALAFGLGPVHSDTPDTLIDSCREAGLTLLAVPAPTPFLTISRAYWTARARSTEQQLNDAVAAHKALVDAAAEPDPGAAILRRLARLLNGWAALLDVYGELDQAYPISMGEELQNLQEEVSRLQVAGVHSSASFTVGQDVVVVLPLAVQDKIVGYLAAGSPRQLEPAQRRVVLTAASLLSLDALRAQRTQSAREATRRCVALLVDLGQPEAARSLAEATGTPAPTPEVAVLVAHSRDSEEVADLVERWCPRVLSVALDRSTVWFVVPNDHPSLQQLEERLRDLDANVASVLSDLVPIDRVGQTRARILRRLDLLGPAEIVFPRGDVVHGVREAIDAFAAAASAELRESLVAYLRHRGQWEQASKALGLHRNTVRYRVERARELLALDLKDPDVAAETWLALRARGMA